MLDLLFQLFSAFFDIQSTQTTFKFCRIDSFFQQRKIESSIMEAFSLSALSPPHYHLLDSVIYVPDSDVIFNQISKWMQATENTKCAPKIFCAILTVPHRKVYKNVPNMCFCNTHSTWLQVPLAASSKNRSCVTTKFRCQGNSGGAS
jgi:hypothetical protein